MSRKIITLVLSLFVLAVLPLVSLYYSFEGASMRKKAMAELVPKGSLPEALTNRIKAGSTLNLFSGNCTDTTILKPLIEQFKDEKIRYIFVGDSLYLNSLSALRMDGYKQTGMFQAVQTSSNDWVTKEKGCEMVLTNTQ